MWFKELLINICLKINFCANAHACWVFEYDLVFFLRCFFCSHISTDHNFKFWIIINCIKCYSFFHDISRRRHTFWLFIADSCSIKTRHYITALSLHVVPIAKWLMVIVILVLSIKTIFSKIRFSSQLLSLIPVLMEVSFLNFCLRYFSSCRSWNFSSGVVSIIS